MRDWDCTNCGSLRPLREENRKLKGIVADLTLDKHILQEVLSKKGLKPAKRRELVRQAHPCNHHPVAFFQPSLMSESNRLPGRLR
jgi:hypothetical protein